jgi:hypothetical protein
MVGVFAGEIFKLCFSLLKHLVLNQQMGCRINLILVNFRLDHFILYPRLDIQSDTGMTQY